MPIKYTRALLLAYGLLNAALYSSLLPLWEGFDEEFHYGYVQYLGGHHRLPVLGRTELSREINQSIGLLPMSYVMINNLHLQGVRTFDEYFALDSATRHDLYRQAHEIPTDLRLTEARRYYVNYEVHHAPLAYLLMVVPDAIFSHASLPTRVWIVRLLASVACVVLMFGAVWSLGIEAGLDDGFAAILVFLIFSCQMFWATIAHIGNDWLAVPLAAWCVMWALRYHRDPDRRNAAWLAAVLALGLLAKAYFLVFVPLYLLAMALWFRMRKMRRQHLLAMLMIPLMVAGPWYLRNLLLYGNFSGRIEETSGVSTSGALSSLASIPWLKSLPFMARGAFWMGNSSFTDFSVGTMNLVLLLLTIAVALYCRHARKVDAFLWAPFVLFCGAMLYVTGSSYAYTKGLAIAASPWYLQAVMPLLLCVALLGCQRSGAAGRGIAIVSVILWGYVLAVTYTAKLLPLYGGFGGGRSTLHDIARWYLHDWQRTSDILSTTSLMPSALLAGLLIPLLIVLGCSAVAVCKRPIS
ncbi:MAG TPA: hypothetical protein VGL72_19030 [Bryobacteraceae bacterium]